MSPNVSGKWDCPSMAIVRATENMFVRIIVEVRLFYPIFGTVIEASFHIGVSN